MNNSSKKPRMQFAYVGSPGKKDYLDVVIDGFQRLNCEQKAQIELHIVGVNEKQLVDMCGVAPEHIAALEGVLHIHGRLPHREAVDWVINSDYTLLLRDETLRYAKAGFPTKIVESLAHGTPPVCNYSSDLSEYLADEDNAFIIHGHTAEDVRDTIERIICRHSIIGEQMRVNARRTAENNFDALNYVDVMRKLIG